MKGLVLSLFPGIGLLDMAFEEAGFCVVRGPDCLWGGDIRKFHPPAGKFDGVIGGPPCQSFSLANNHNRSMGVSSEFGNLIPEFDRCVNEARPDWFVMENVPQAPAPGVVGYAVHSFLLNNRQLGESQNRVRRWSFGRRGLDRRTILHVETQIFEHPEYDYAASTGGGLRDDRPKQAKRMLSHGVKSRNSEAAFLHFSKIQGLPEGFDLTSFKSAAKCKAVCNGVPLAMGRAIANAVVKAVEA